MYKKELDANLEILVERFRSGTYRAPPVRRVYIPKGKGKKPRPIGVPTFEDKILQRAVTMILTAVYEEDFLDFSYGFRPGRSAHQALKALRTDLMATWGGYVIELDIEQFFDTMSHNKLGSFLDKRICDGVLRRMIGKWLKAGVLENGTIRRNRFGSPQGGVISPLLANLYLHEVLDKWFITEVQPRLRGGSSMVRYADDGVLVFAREDDARRVFEVLPKRFAKFGLRLHPEKTRLLPFVSPGRTGRKKDRKGKPGSFDFLGITHYWAVSQRGYNVVKQKTAKDRFRRSLHNVTIWCQKHRHDPVKEQSKKLGRIMEGHYGYYGITGNNRSLSNYAQEVRAIWLKWLSRRSWKSQITWENFHSMLKRYPLPFPRIKHKYRIASP